ncbi:MAG: methyl-accepting chemotaxis protein [Bacillus sp. (in: firmicutes)]
MKSIKQKIIISFSIILLLMVGISSIGYVGNKKADEKLESLLYQNYERVSVSSQLIDNLRQRITAARGYLLFEKSSYKDDFLQKTKESDELERQLTSLVGDREDCQRAIERMTEWEQSLTEQIFPTYEQEGAEAAITQMEELAPISKEALNSLLSINDDFHEKMLTEGNSMLSSSQTQMNLFLVIASIGIVCAVVISVLLSRSIINPIGAVVKRLAEIASNNLTGTALSFNRKDEFHQLASATNSVTTNLRDMISKITAAEENLSVTSKELFHNKEVLTKEAGDVQEAVSHVAKGSGAQLEGATETANSMEYVTGNVTAIANSSASVSEYTVGVNKYASKGNEMIQQTIMQMKKIDSVSSQTSSIIDSLEKRTNKIGQLTGAITDIADQTNLLALNAAIEAARAGENGKGFTVVAEEVRKLAEQSKDSSQHIIELISAILLDMTNIISSNNESRTEISNGLTAVQNAGEAFHNILESIQNITSQLQEVSASSEEISANAEEVSASVQELAGIAEQNVVSTNQMQSSTEQQLHSMDKVAATINQLNEMAQELRAIMAKFEI